MREKSSLSNQPARQNHRRASGEVAERGFDEMQADGIRLQADRLAVVEQFLVGLWAGRSAVFATRADHPAIDDER